MEPQDLPMPSAATLGSLTDALIENVFALVCAEQMGGGAPVFRPCAALPLVSKRWRHVYVHSTILWESLQMDWSSIMQLYILVAPPTYHIPRYECAVRWLEDRAPVLRFLVLTGCAALGSQGLRNQLARLATQATRLQRLALYDVVGSADGPVQQLARCSALKSISLRCEAQAAGRLHPLVVSVTALQSLSALRALSSLDLAVDRILGSTRDLQDALGALACLTVSCREEAAILHPELLSVASALAELRISNVRLASFTGSQVAVLKRLTHLGCSDVCAAQPRKGGKSLWDALRHLEGLRELCVEDQSHVGLPANALACTGLEGLTVLRSAMGPWPSPASLTVEPGCLRSLRSLQLGFLTLQQQIPAVMWAQLTALTRLSWQQIRHGEQREHNMLVPQPPMMEVPADMSRLTGLRQLSIEYCELAALPPCVQALPELEGLSLEGNCIANLPEGPYLQGIQQLNLAANDLVHLPEGVQAARRLRLLSLTRNAGLVLDGGSGDPAVVQLLQLPHVERIYVTEANGLRMGAARADARDESHADADEDAGALAYVQQLRPGLVVWGEAPPGLW